MALALFVVVAAPASAITSPAAPSGPAHSAGAGHANRIVKTTCLYNPAVAMNTIYTVKAIDGTVRHTTVPCKNLVPDITRPNYTVSRPTTDIIASRESADRWWTRCSPVWYGMEGPQQFQGRDWYFIYYEICTA